MGYLKNKDLQERNKELRAKFSETKTNNAIGMYSGGLDSILAAMLIKEQGYNVYLVHFVSPFFGHTKTERDRMKRFVESLGMHFIEYKMPETYIDNVLYNPKYGYGKSINPCIDCHSYMFYLAAQMLVDMPADFVFTGEVMGQRPMSQNKIALHIVEVMSGLEGRLLRPLSAKILQPTLVEEKGWIDRTRLLGISGRGRKTQTELAEKYKITEYPQPAGGCHLTDRSLKPRFQALNSIVKAKDWKLLKLLRIGRHFVFKELGFYMVVARDKDELSLLNDVDFQRFTVRLQALNTAGAIALIFNKDMYEYGAYKVVKMNTFDYFKMSDVFGVYARYTKAFKENSLLNVGVQIANDSGQFEQLSIVEGVRPYNDVNVGEFRV